MTRGNILALDVGAVRVGMAWARADVAVAISLPTLNRTQPNFWTALDEIIASQAITTIVIGLPRGLDGQETAQTQAARAFGAELKKHCTTELAITWQDEAATSIQAEAALQQSKRPYAKADIDALAAVYILNDYLETHRRAVPR